ncbi:MAG: PspC domain-containing protein [Acidimicrobiales bacterium]
MTDLHSPQPDDDSPSNDETSTESSTGLDHRDAPEPAATDETPATGALDVDGAALLEAAARLDDPLAEEPTDAGAESVTGEIGIDSEADADPIEDATSGGNDPAGSDPFDGESAGAEPGEPTATTPPPMDPPPMDPPPPLPPVRRLRRAEGSSGPGVAAGIARYFGVETGLVKAAFVVASFFGGLGIFVYIAGWALIPRDRHPDPRPVVLNGSVAGIVIGTLAMVGAVSVAFGAGGAAGSLLAPALLIGIGFYLLDQRSTPQVITDAPTQPASRPSWIPPLTTTPLPPSTTHAYAATAAPAPQWGTVHTDPAPPVATKPKPPVTAVTMAITAVVVAAMIALDQFTGVDISVPQMFGTALAIIVTGIIVSLFVGRALGLWFAGIIALIGLGVSPIAVAITVDGVGSREYRVLDGESLLPSYVLGTGELIIDLRDAEFTSDAATTIDLDAGSIVVYLPDDVTIDLDATARFGVVTAPIKTTDGGFGITLEEVSGSSSEIQRIYSAREGAPTVSIDADVRFGSIEIRQG